MARYEYAEPYLNIGCIIGINWSLIVPWLLSDKVANIGLLWLCRMLWLSGTTSRCQLFHSRTCECHLRILHLSVRFSVNRQLQRSWLAYRSACQWKLRCDSVTQSSTHLPGQQPYVGMPAYPNYGNLAAPYYSLGMANAGFQYPATMFAAAVRCARLLVVCRCVFNRDFVLLRRCTRLRSTPLARPIAFPNPPQDLTILHVGRFLVISPCELTGACNVVPVYHFWASSTHIRFISICNVYKLLISFFSIDDVFKWAVGTVEE